MSKSMLVIAVSGVIFLLTATAISERLTNTASVVPSTPSASSPSPVREAPSSKYLETGYHLGLNFFVFPRNATDDTARALTAPETATQLQTLHAEVARQLTNGDTLWSAVEPKANAWNWATTDSMFQSFSSSVEPIADLFSMQYASPNAPWNISGPFEKTMTAEAETYIRTVVRRYKDSVTYWEIGNEMDHWKLLDPGNLEAIHGKFSDVTEKLPTLLPSDGYSPAEQGAFFAATANIVREEDPDAILVMPGMSAAQDYQLNTWLPGFVAGAGTDAFDIVNYHDYGSWSDMEGRLSALKASMQTLGIANKPIWLSETGSSADTTLTQRTNYPNSTVTQAADVIRRLLIAQTNGVSTAIWHTFYSSPSTGTNTWRAYGLLNEHGEESPSYGAFATLAEVFPATSVEDIATTPGTYIVKITSSHDNVAYAVWGSGTWTIPEGIAEEYTISSTGVAKSAAPAEGSTVTLSPIPQLFR